MKKSIISVFTALLLASAAGAQNVSLTNTFGGTSDFLKFDKDGNKQDAIVGDRIQLDVASENVDARVRLNFSGDKNYVPGLQAYVNVRPVQPLNIIGGNKFSGNGQLHQPTFLPSMIILHTESLLTITELVLF